MTKTLALVALTLGLTFGLSSLGCYAQRLFQLPRNDPFYEELNAVRVEYVRRMEDAWKHLPKGPEREQAMEEWQRQNRAEQEVAERAIYEKHGRAYPETVYPGPP